MKDSPKHWRWLECSGQAHRLQQASQGVFRGLAQTMGFGSYVAACAEVSVSKEAC